MNLMNNEKRYNSLNNYLRAKFSSKIFKVSLNANFTCPHMSTGGCTFCLEGSGNFAGKITDDLKTQFTKIKNNLHQKWPTAKYIAYFQANTNTLGELDYLKKLYEEALTLDENIVGLSISTRPDCLTDELIEYFKTLSQKTYLTIELGLQSIHDVSLELINRGHNYLDFERAVEKLRAKNINVIVHIINGLPNETKEMMVNTVKKLNSLDIQGIKIHLLHLMKNTVISEQFLQKPFEILTLEKYVEIVCNQLEILNNKIIVHRLTGDSPKEMLIAPLWSLKKFVVINEIDKEMRRRGSFQGCLE